MCQLDVLWVDQSTGEVLLGLVVELVLVGVSFVQLVVQFVCFDFVFVFRDFHTVFHNG